MEHTKKIKSVAESIGFRVFYDLIQSIFNVKGSSIYSNGFGLVQC